MDYPIIEEKIKVFVSSAMGPESDEGSEDDFLWLEFRKKVKEELNKCPYIQAFTIEDRASTMRSVSFMMSNVDFSDIVVLLIKNEFRDGTKEEYIHCRETNKPLLVFFFGDGNESEKVKDLRKDIQKDDICLYRNMSDFINAEKIIANAVIQDVVFFYRDKHRKAPLLHPIDIDGVPIKLSIENEPFVPTKNVLSQFKTCYQTLYEYIGLSDLIKSQKDAEKSNLHTVGEQVIRWVINGEHFLSSDTKAKLVASVEEIYNSTDWYAKRLDAIDFYIQGDIVSAYTSEKEALKLAEDANIAPWIRENILIDLRNLQLICPKEQLESKDENYQNRIDELDSIVHVPVLDRYLENTYETLLHEEIKRNTASIGTVFYGNSLDRILSGVENYLFSSLLYGSYTHLNLTREIFATIFYRTGVLYSSSELLFASIKMYLFSAQYKDFIRLSNLEWSRISNIMILKADELWNQAFHIQERSKDIICLGVLYRVGLYLNDQSFIDAEKYILNLSSRLPWDISDNFIDCLLNIYIRMNQDTVVKIVTILINTFNYITANHLSQLICRIDFSKASDKILNELCETLKTGIQNMLSSNGDPQFIAVLVKARPDIFKVLENIPNNGLTGIQKLLYDLNTNNGSWKEIIISEIDSAQKQFIANNQKGCYSQFATNPYGLISEIFKENVPAEIISIITEKFLPLCIDILNSECAIETKDQCTECLCTALGYYKKNNLSIPTAMIDCIDKISLENTSGFTMDHGSIEGLKCRFLTLKILVGVLDKQVLIEWCLSYSKKDAAERRSLIECVNTYLQYSTNAQKDVDSLILSIVYQCCEDQDIYIRSFACECLWYILESQYSKQAEEKIYEMTLDPAPAIRYKLLSICEDNSQRHIDIIKKIILRLIDDANYRIREFAKKLLKIIFDIYDK